MTATDLFDFDFSAIKANVSFSGFPYSCLSGQSGRKKRTHSLLADKIVKLKLCIVCECAFFSLTRSKA